MEEKMKKIFLLSVVAISLILLTSCEAYHESSEDPSPYQELKDKFPAYTLRGWNSQESFTVCKPVEIINPGLGIVEIERQRDKIRFCIPVCPARFMEIGEKVELVTVYYTHTKGYVESFSMVK